MKQSIRVGLCGFGFMGKTHLYALSNLPYFYDLPYRAKVIGVCTAHRETADSAAEAFGIRRVYACEADMIADGDIDVIDICTPNPCHFTTARAAITAGKHVLCEKPLTASAEESRELAQLAASTGLTCGVVFNNRFLSPVLRARQLAEEGRLGRILSFDFAYRHNSCIDPERTVGWKQRATCGGGTLADLGPHVIDLCRLLCGEIVSVMGKSQIAFPTHRVPEGEWLTDADEAFYLTATTASGAVGQITVSKLTQGANDELTFSVYRSADCAVLHAWNAWGALTLRHCPFRHPKHRSVGYVDTLGAWSTTYLPCMPIAPLTRHLPTVPPSTGSLPPRGAPMQRGGRCRYDVLSTLSHHRAYRSHRSRKGRSVRDLPALGNPFHRHGCGVSRPAGTAFRLL